MVAEAVVADNDGRDERVETNRDALVHVGAGRRAALRCMVRTRRILRGALCDEVRDEAWGP